MAEKIPVRVQHKRMSANEWKTSPVILLEGELGIESDTGYVKVGDGKNSFSKLKYLSGPQGPKGIQGSQGPPGPAGKDGISPDMRDYATKKDIKDIKQDLAGMQGVVNFVGALGEETTKIEKRLDTDFLRTSDAFKIVQITETAYKALSTKDSKTLYLIV